MNRFVVLALVSCLPSCSNGSSNSGGPSGQADASGVDAEPDGSSVDATSGGDGSPDSGSAQDASAVDSGEVADGSAPDAGYDASCPQTWWLAPTVDPSIQVPTDGGAVILHAAGAGTQNYACTMTDAGTVWTLTGPSAVLSDCHGMLVGHHFASEAGVNYPEWETTDGTYVIGDKIGHFTPDGGADSVSWLLLQEVSTGGSGTLSQAAYVQRLFTDGGVAPGPGCDAGDTLQVPYGADYYFYGE